MTPFKDIVLKDNQPTEPGIRAMEMVYEKLTGECWHDWYLAGDPAYPTNRCSKCMGWLGEDNIKFNPALLTSLDDWRPLWERMEVLGIAHAHSLIEIILPRANKNEHGYYELIAGEFYLYMVAQPHHHLEAALKTLEDTCPDCEGTGMIPCDNPDHGFIDVMAATKRGFASGKYQCPACGYSGEVPCTCNNGKITLYELWERGVEG